ncbi:MAG: cation:proton antiporter [Anaerolineales bacterium]|nr:cation:proton antiporter [Anaerolineales bacterium]
MQTLTDMELTRFFFALVLLLLFSHTFGFLLNRLKLPRVIGEIFGGLLLGPTVLGYFSPNAYTWLFSAFESEGKLISLMSWLGLILLMFVSGFEIEKSLDKDDRRIILVLIIGSTVLPFFAGWVAPSMYDFTPYLGVKNNIIALQLVIAIATAITSIPVISKIFMDLGVMNTRFAKIVLSIATIHDVLLWIVLAVATGMVNAETPSIWQITTSIVLTIAFFGLTLFFMPKAMLTLIRSRYNLLIRSSISGYILFICFLFAAIASLLSVNVVFGALLAGIVIGLMPRKFMRPAKNNVKDISLALFVPLYFAIVGLKLDFVHNFEPVFFLWFLTFTTLFQTLGTVISAKLIKKDWLSSFNFGVAMSTRGGPGIVLATVAFDLGIINEVFFVTLVSIAITTSLFAGTWFKYVLSKGWQLLNDEPDQPLEVSMPDA